MRAKSPDEAKLGFSDFERTNLDGGKRPRRKAHISWGYPRLVREHPGHRYYKPFRGSAVHAIAGLWKYASEPDWANSGSRFRNRILKIVPDIGLLRPSSTFPSIYIENLQTDTLVAWRERSREFFVILEFIKLLKDHTEDFPLQPLWWDELRRTHGRTEPFPATHEWAGAWKEPSSELGRMWFGQTQWQGEFEARKIQTVQEARDVMRLEYMKQFIGMARGAIALQLSADGLKFTAEYIGGSWGWSLYELARLCGAKDLRICECGVLFAIEHGNDVYCSTACRERLKKRRQRASQ